MVLVTNQDIIDERMPAVECGITLCGSHISHDSELLQVTILGVMAERQREVTPDVQISVQLWIDREIGCFNEIRQNIDALLGVQWYSLARFLYEDKKSYKT